VVASLQVPDSDVAPPCGLSYCGGMRWDSLNPPASSPYYLYTLRGDYTPIARGSQAETPRSAENF